jgi:hypothetical protein
VKDLVESAGRSSLIELLESMSSSTLARQLQDVPEHSPAGRFLSWANALNQARSPLLTDTGAPTAFQELLAAAKASQGHYAQLLNVVERAAHNPLLTAIGGAVERAQRLSLESQSPLGRWISQMTEGGQLLHERLRGLSGPFENLARGTTSLIERSAELRALTRLPGILEEQFRIPQVQEYAELIGRTTAHQHPELQPSNAFTDLLTAMQRMSTPWLSCLNEQRSIEGFAALQHIGERVRTALHAYDDRLVAFLRGQLGDWRAPLAWPNNLENLATRTLFYERLGFNTNLTHFPAPAFQQSLATAGLDERTPAAVPDHLYHIPAESSAEDVQFERTNRAHDQLMRFETHMRRFVSDRLNGLFGTKWVKQRVPNDVRQRWTDRKQAALESGDSALPLINYADFMDLLPIIVRADNWEAIFRSVFLRRESVEESFRRLHPIRLSTMHARMISQEDELYLIVEVRRLLKAIGVLH